MGPKVLAMLFICMIVMLMTLPPTYACGYCETPPHPPHTGGGGVPQPTCPINALKLGLCVDLLGGLVHVGLRNPVENVGCPIASRVDGA
ncbi:bifunctional inhibitor/lipid-transfer protein/seed storage 2S albumin superfamily protein [Actinidia rufa]|uniref:Bifunctional inhibitor/lipid-transfer protein/seed storage 2S albumin superfamily protein n=1 Tax=Actinidia rufa TaxID=165716 RepID=A0A7J0FR85_9ERIC|nr:bifunctional inhibitor/lipid-transfer protein/seed storage 2S albumin superfamily protein [Actinidia rufa]